MKKIVGKFFKSRRSKSRSILGYNKNLIKQLNLRTLDLSQEDLDNKYNLVVNLPAETQQILFMNDIYLLEDKENQKKTLLVHFLDKLNIGDFIDDIAFDEICYATDKTMELFIQNYSKIGKVISQEEGGAIDFIETLFRTARATNASDIYILLDKKDLIIKLRNSLGIQEVARFGLKEANILRNTLEFLANQESGTLRYDGKIIYDNIEYRINFYKNFAGWDCTIRNYSDEFGSKLTLEVLGYTSKQRIAIKKMCLNQSGVILYVAQTGQGKTTTQNANMIWLYEQGLKVVTSERPVEKYLKGISQIDLSEYETADEEFKLDGKTALKLFLRAKPDVINMGEIRDKEEALLAHEASITGHLVFATLHANDVDSGIDRLIKAGLSVEDVKTVVRGIVYQQLTRKLCDKCKRKTDEDGHYMANEEGCPECVNGYARLRTPIVEIAHYPYNRKFDLEDRSSYEDYISIEESAKEKYDMGMIDALHYDSLIKGYREPNVYGLTNEVL